MLLHVNSKGLAIHGAWEFRPTIHRDSRGEFLESFASDEFQRVTRRPFHLAQINTSVSQLGVIRGIHSAAGSPGQAKYVTCVSGCILDVVVDLRPSSPTFGDWAQVILDDNARSALFLSEGLGHGFQVLSPRATVVYATTTTYDPKREFAVHPFDSRLALPWVAPLRPSLSARDAGAPSLSEALILAQTLL